MFNLHYSGNILDRFIVFDSKCPLLLYNHVTMYLFIFQELDEVECDQISVRIALKELEINKVRIVQLSRNLQLFALTGT